MEPTADRLAESITVYEINLLYRRLSMQRVTIPISPVLTDCYPLLENRELEILAVEIDRLTRLYEAERAVEALSRPVAAPFPSLYREPRQTPLEPDYEPYQALSDELGDELSQGDDTGEGAGDGKALVAALKVSFEKLTAGNPNEWFTVRQVIRGHRPLQTYNADSVRVALEMLTEHKRLIFLDMPDGSKKFRLPVPTL
jgi:hypothetical protein